MYLTKKHDEKIFSTSLTRLVRALRQQQIIAYPTEAVFGLGCDPDSESAVRKLLTLKKRPWQKGFILVASNYTQLMPYIDDSALDNIARARILNHLLTPVTWVMPARPNIPFWLTGDCSSIAVRICTFKPVYHLCLAFKKPLISTSANLTGYPPARTAVEVHEQLGKTFLIMNEAIEGRRNPSEIRDIRSGALIRQG
ncbi:Sua5/YciO/YrdC/YwlC family protein [Candidatus Curculioniphilus buchneri]|uniref:Sua5/YciO/YrdC/YwlC family protein n=1 Tax=Candidatus Curculioniphilus buchneri TaxID=690594 RepID=UPI00376F44D3